MYTFLRVFDQGFKQDGGVGTYLDKTLEPHYVPYTYKTYLGIRFWYDNIFYYIAITTIFQMFLSIINNYFSSQREDQEKFAEIVETQCIICGIEREALEKMYSNHKAAFEIHTNHDHNIIDYISETNSKNSENENGNIYIGSFSEGLKNIFLRTRFRQQF